MLDAKGGFESACPSCCRSGRRTSLSILRRRVQIGSCSSSSTAGRASLPHLAVFRDRLRNHRILHFDLTVSQTSSNPSVIRWFACAAVEAGTFVRGIIQDAAGPDPSAATDPAPSTDPAAAFEKMLADQHRRHRRTATSAAAHRMGAAAVPNLSNSTDSSLRPPSAPPSLSAFPPPRSSDQHHLPLGGWEKRHGSVTPHGDSEAVGFRTVPPSFQIQERANDDDGNDESLNDVQ